MPGSPAVWEQLRLRRVIPMTAYGWGTWNDWGRLRCRVMPLSPVPDAFHELEYLMISNRQPLSMDDSEGHEAKWTHLKDSSKICSRETKLLAD